MWPGKKTGTITKAGWAIDADPKKPGKVKIIDQEHAAELLEMAKDYMA